MSNLIDELKLKPFNYDRAKAGFPVVCIYSSSYVYEVRQLMFCQERGSYLTVAADIDKNGIVTFTDKGLSTTEAFKLCMKTVTKTVYRNSYEISEDTVGIVSVHHDFSSKEAALRHKDIFMTAHQYISKIICIAEEVEIEQ